MCSAFFVKSAIPPQLAPLQRLRVCRLEARGAEHGKVAPDLGQLCRCEWLLLDVVWVLRHLFAMVAQAGQEVNGLVQDKAIRASQERCTNLGVPLCSSVKRL